MERARAQPPGLCCVTHRVGRARLSPGLRTLFLSCLCGWLPRAAACLPALQCARVLLRRRVPPAVNWDLAAAIDGLKVHCRYGGTQQADGEWMADERDVGSLRLRTPSPRTRRRAASKARAWRLRMRRGCRRLPRQRITPRRLLRHCPHSKPRPDTPRQNTPRSRSSRRAAAAASCSRSRPRCHGGRRPARSTAQGS